ncbi:OST-HTH/LOTUS domain-containing protein [Leptolyngbya sp. BC1307]|uniref:OST-HTH/LOTUS domain-containing protein n=1 Tax=Leptolyngbya sp. BC1307 TaxID=2029589 RepID=UPI000EFAF16B|nr:OST-HTH/LOTUS domain-containing protein [Leptolyngbya sp. BC1307]
MKPALLRVFMRLGNLIKSLLQYGSSVGVAACTRKTGEQLKQDTKLMNLLRGAVTAIQDENGWSRLSTVGAHISNQASFDSRNYGYANLSGLFEAIDSFEVDRRDKTIYVRSKQKGKNGKKTA